MFITGSSCPEQKPTIQSTIALSSDTNCSSQFDCCLYSFSLQILYSYLRFDQSRLSQSLSCVTAPRRTVTTPDVAWKLMRSSTASFTSRSRAEWPRAMVSTLRRAGRSNCSCRRSKRNFMLGTSEQGYSICNKPAGINCSSSCWTSAFSTKSPPSSSWPTPASREQTKFRFHQIFDAIEEQQESTAFMTHPFYPNVSDFRHCDLCSRPLSQHAQIDVDMYKAVQREGGRLQQCDSCLDQLPLSLMYSHSRCQRICLKCLRSFLEEGIKNRNTTLVCPGCKQQLSRKEVKNIVGRQSMAQLARFQKEERLRKEPLMRECPGVDCRNFIQVGKDSRQFCQCQECGTKVCIACSREWHKGLTCDEVLRQELADYKEEVTTCPECRMAVMKASGCNHMTCSYCKHQFCWLCKSTYTQVHFMPLNPFGCPGLQNGNQDRRKWGTLKRWSYKLLILIGMLLAFPFALVIGLVAGGPYLLYQTRLRRHKLAMVLLGLALNPLVWVGVLLAILPTLVYFAVQYLRSRWRRRRMTQEFLRSSLIQNYDLAD